MRIPSSSPSQRPRTQWKNNLREANVITSDAKIPTIEELAKWCKNEEENKGNGDTSLVEVVEVESVKTKQRKDKRKTEKSKDSKLQTPSNAPNANHATKRQKMQANARKCTKRQKMQPKRQQMQGVVLSKQGTIG